MATLATHRRSPLSFHQYLFVLSMGLSGVSASLSGKLTLPFRPGFGRHVVSRRHVCECEEPHGVPRREAFLYCAALDILRVTSKLGPPRIRSLPAGGLKHHTAGSLDGGAESDCSESAVASVDLWPATGYLTCHVVASSNHTHHTSTAPAPPRSSCGS